MPQISKVERDHDIKQVSRLEDLKPATEKTVSRATPQIRGKPQINETQQNLQTSVNAARRASIAAIRHAKTISESSDKNEDQQAIDKMETSARNAAAVATEAALDAKDSLKEALKNYKGTVIMVCHDPSFYEGLATRVIDFEKEKGI